MSPSAALVARLRQPWERVLQGAREIGHNATTRRATNVALAAVARRHRRTAGDVGTRRWYVTEEGVTAEGCHGSEMSRQRDVTAERCHGRGMSRQRDVTAERCYGR